MLSPAGESWVCHSAIPRASGSTSSLGDFFVEAGDQRAAADGAHGLARDGPGLDGHAEIVSELEQKLVKDIFLTSVRFDVVDAVEQRTFEIVAVRLPRADVGGIELEDAEAEVAGEHGFSSLIFLAARRRRSLVSSCDGFEPALVHCSRLSGSAVLREAAFHNKTMVQRPTHSTALQREPLFLTQQKNQG